jgi:TetR/AcrR family transcriptional repressor of nem operon
MRVSREQAAENRERILAVAARLFRERGFDGIGVAELMQGAGLTHGGFYGHFASKDDLAAQACERALAESAGKWATLADEDDPLAAVAASYLSVRHRDDPGRGCVLAALGTDVPRQNASVRRAVTGGFNRLIDVLARLVPGRSKAAKREKALATMASLVGAVVLARAVDDPALSKDILRAATNSLPG